MILATISDRDQVIVDRWNLLQPFSGEWRATFRVTGPAASGEAITVDDGDGNTWVGAVVSAVPDGAFTVANVVGGRGRLAAMTRRRFYSGGAAVASVLADLCGDAGELAEAPTIEPLPQWRTRGNSLRDEVALLARWSTGAWRITPGGLVSLVVASGETDPPGLLTDAANGARVYDATTLPPLAGLTVDGVRVGRVHCAGGRGTRATVATWALEERPLDGRAPAVAGRVLSASAGRVDVALDDGTQLKGLPLFGAAGFAVTLTPGARVLVIDLNDDPRATIALCGAADGVATKISAGIGSSPAVRTDKMMIELGKIAAGIATAGGSYNPPTVPPFVGSEVVEV